MENEKIKELLQNRFHATPIFPKKRHIIFWYDEGGSFKNSLSELSLNGVKIIELKKSINKKDEEIDINIFKTKYTLEVLDTESNYLIYSEYPRPEKDQENFLLDIEKYSSYFRADRTAFIVEELSLDRLNYELVETVKTHELFFASKERKEKLAKLLEGRVDNEELKLGILAVLSGTKNLNFKEVLKSIILDSSKLEQIQKFMKLDYLFDKIKNVFNLEINSFDKFMKILVTVHFYREMRSKPHTNLENYYVGDRNELYLFVDSLLQNKVVSEKLKIKFFEIGKELNFKDQIDGLQLERVVMGTGFEYFDVLVIRELAEKLSHGLTDFETYKKQIDIRLDNTLWKEKYIHLYRGLKSAIDILQIKNSLIIKNVKNLEELHTLYIKEYYKIDRLYREFIYFYDLGKIDENNGVLDSLENIIGSFYENEYLEPLLSEWSEKFEIKNKISQQKNFYNLHVKKSDTRVAVIISDALRYEVATEIKEKLLKEANTKEIALLSMLTGSPSITSLGMANLLPFSEELNYNLESKKVTIKEIATNTTENRENILKLAEKDSSAITFDNLKNMHRTEREEYIKGKKVIYIYHDSIDATGDKGKTESKTFEACATGVKDIVGMSKLLSNLGVVNIFITSDHGFLYERKEIVEHDKLELKNSYLIAGKRYALSKNEFIEKGCRTLNLGEYYGVFPEKNQRIKTQGSGLQFVHGGISPQEMIVPLIKYRSGANATKSRKVDAKIKGDVGKITSTLSKFGIYQIDSVNVYDKILERLVSVALYTTNGIKVSNEEKIMLNSFEDNNLYNFRLTLSGNHKKVILKLVDLDSEDILDSKEYDVNLSIASEFDF
ncbi:MAG: BREX-1 system phosphatase PglZ type A [Fusobacteriaceae bacterium]